MGEKSVVQVVNLMQRGVPLESLTNIPQTAFIRNLNDRYSTKKEWNEIHLNSHSECTRDKKKFATNFKHIETESNKIIAGKLIQEYNDKQIIVNPPWPPYTEKELDSYFDLPYTRLPHPKYNGKGSIPAYEMIRHSVNIHRGCFGGCAFCTISAHQGKHIVSRSEKSVLKEVKKITEMSDFKGYLSDVGGPSANMYRMSGIDMEICRCCSRPSCIYPSVCKNLETDHQHLTNLYKQVEKVEGVKKAFIGSGIRYDLVFHETGNPKKDHRNIEYLKRVIRKNVSGRLKVAPEHSSERVLKIMRKTNFGLFKRLNKIFVDENKRGGLKQQLIPYFISSHPGSTVEDMAELAAETKSLDFRLEQVQDFTPTPMTLATVIYYSGYHPYTLEKVSVAKTKEEKLNQRKFFFWYKKENVRSIMNDLKRMRREDLIRKLFK
jgi:uncharacterized radical SAM protein YgiQ